MRKLYILILSLGLVFSPSLASAKEPKLIHLRDGSKLTGNVVALKGGVYTIKTQNLGTMEVNQNDIISISNPRFAPKEATQATEANNTDFRPSLTKSNLNSQVQVMQQNIMSDPELMNEIQGLISDPEIVQVLSDKDFVNSMMALDYEAIENHPKYRKLMHNYKMRKFIDKLKSKGER